MKNLKGVGLLLLALVLGLAAAVYASVWAARKANQAASNKVVVAATDIGLGTKINPQMLTLVDWPAGAVPQGAFKQVKDLQDRVVKTSVLKGEPLLERQLAPAGVQGGLSSLIEQGKRAMTVRVNDVVGVAGFALPGNYVDIMVNAQEGKGQEARSVSKTVLEHVLVLAVAQEANRDDTKPKVVNAVTLELSPADAEKLDLARSVGTLSLVLRNQVDQQIVHTAGSTKAQLFGEAESLPAAAMKLPPPPVHMPAPPRRVVARKGKHAASASHFAARDCVEVIQGGRQVLDCF